MICPDAVPAVARHLVSRYLLLLPDLCEGLC